MPSNVEDAIVALKDFQFEVESCQQTTELAFQHVSRVHGIVNSRTLQRRSSVSTISGISTQILKSSTEPQATTNSGKDIIDWLKRQDVALKSHSGTPNTTTQAGRGVRTGRITEENTSTLASQPILIGRDPQLSKNWLRTLFGLSKAKQDHKKMKCEAYRDYMIVGPFQSWPLPLQQLLAVAAERPVLSSHDVLSGRQPSIDTMIYG